MSKYQVNEKGFYGAFGGAYVPEILYGCVHELQEAYRPIVESAQFKAEYHALLRDYVGRPSPLYYARRMSQRYGCRLYLKREDLNHMGAHKINNTIGQILLARQMGKTRITCETGAGQRSWRQRCGNIFEEQANGKRIWELLDFSCPARQYLQTRLHQLEYICASGTSIRRVL